MSASRLLRSVAPLLALVQVACGAGAGSADASAEMPASCDGLTLAQLREAKTISEQCKAALSPYLPPPSNDFAGRVLVLGRQVNADGSRRLLVAGADPDGKPLSADAFAHARVTASAGEVDLALRVTPFSSLRDDALSLELVNDYSASMSYGDLTAVGELEQTLITSLPPIFEGEVTLFSTEVRVMQSFTTDRSALSHAVELDRAFDREFTALYDGMGSAVDSLASRSRPARVMIVSTDGLENASVAYRKSDVLAAIAASDVTVVMLGGLFANVNELKSLAGPHGTFFYTPLYSDLRQEAAGLVQAVAAGAAIDLPPSLADAGPLTLEVGGDSVQIQ